MKFSAGIMTIAAAMGFQVVSGAPLAARQAPITDGDILNYALTLEHLENAFYAEGLKKFTKKNFIDAGFTGEFYENLVIIRSDEATHVDFLQKGLTAAGAIPVKPCTYKFPGSTPEEFVMVSGILEGVGVSAYLGAAASIMEKAYLTAAGSILTVEARHSSYIRAANKQAPFPQPFDTPLSFNQVFSLAVQFIVECPADQPMLPFKSFPALTFVAAEGEPEVKAGSTIWLFTPTTAVAARSTTVAYDQDCIYAAFMTVTGPIFVKAQKVGDKFAIVIPQGINGQSYVILTSSNTGVTDDNTIAGPAIIEITNY
ncbi:Ferritin/ribonucleotide reductase-like protein [Morchella snyderi]|nr:Ferritin/ribonucleotide reductase-like protein [Morchella snyderi]